MQFPSLKYTKRKKWISYSIWDCCRIFKIIRLLFFVCSVQLQNKKNSFPRTHTKKLGSHRLILFFLPKYPTVRNTIILHAIDSIDLNFLFRFTSQLNLAIFIIKFLFLFLFLTLFYTLQSTMFLSNCIYENF